LDEKNNFFDNIICGKNSVAELLKSGREIDCLYVLKGREGSVGIAGKLIAESKNLGIPVKDVAKEKLDRMTDNANHQGIAATVSAAEYKTVDDLFFIAEQKNEPPFFIICDEIEDQHNLGAIIRTAEAAGVHGIIIPKRRGASLTPVVAKVASGALEYVAVARVSNLASTIDILKKRGVWIYGTDMKGQCYTKTDFGGALALVIGSEQNGIGRLISEKCDFLVSLPMKGKINSLNASAAAAVFVYEIMKCRGQLSGVKK